MKKLLNTKQAAAITGYNIFYLRRLAREGILKTIRLTPTSQMKFLEDDLISLTQAPKLFPPVKYGKKKPLKK